MLYYGTCRIESLWRESLDILACFDQSALNQALFKQLVFYLNELTSDGHKRVSCSTVRCLGTLSGSTLLEMPREELKTLCPEEGGRVFSQLQAVQSTMAVSERLLRSVWRLIIISLVHTGVNTLCFFVFQHRRL